MICTLFLLILFIHALYLRIQRECQFTPNFSPFCSVVNLSLRNLTFKGWNKLVFKCQKRVIKWRQLRDKHVSNKNLTLEVKKHANFQRPQSNRFNIRSQFCPTVPSFEIVFSPLVFRLFNYSCYFYISRLEFDAQFEIFDGKATCKRTEQLSTLLGQQCWELLGPCWQWCANACNNSQKWWDLHSTSWEGQIPSKDLVDHV